jgi:hypothetical protein
LYKHKNRILCLPFRCLEPSLYLGSTGIVEHGCAKSTWSAFILENYESSLADHGEADGGEVAERRGCLDAVGQTLDFGDGEADEMVLVTVDEGSQDDAH